VGSLGSLVGQLRTEAGENGCALAGFDFPIGVPEFYAKRGGVASFRTLLSKLGCGDWEDFYSVCDQPGQISVHRSFYPNGAYEGRRKKDLPRRLVSRTPAGPLRAGRQPSGQAAGGYFEFSLNPLMTMLPRRI